MFKKISVYTAKKLWTFKITPANASMTLAQLMKDLDVLAFYKHTDQHLLYPLAFSTKLFSLEDNCIIQAVPLPLANECVVYTHSKKGSFVFVISDTQVSVERFLLKHAWIPVDEQPSVATDRQSSCIDKKKVLISDLMEKYKSSTLHLYFESFLKNIYF